MQVVERPRIEKSLCDVPKEAWIGWMSSLVEAYNMGIYSFIAPVLSKLLFQKTSSWKAIFFSYCLVFIGSSLLYPLGAIYYGFIGDKKGRRKICTYSTLGLGIATGLMGVISLNTLGEYAWIYFLFCICMQHFFSGGEYHGSIVFSLEHLEKRQEGLMSAISCLFAVAGLMTANGLAVISFFRDEEIWIRISFLIGGVGGFISYIIKKYCHETPAFQAIPKNQDPEMSLISFFKDEWQQIGGVILAFSFFSIAYSFIFIFLPLVHPDQTPGDSFKTLIVYGLLLVAAGWIADRWEINKVMLAGSTLFSLAIIPVCSLFSSLFGMQLVLTALACLVIGPIHSWSLDQFAVQKRCKGVFISAAITTAVIGGSTIPICLLIFETFHSLAICGLYPLTASLALTYYLYYKRETYEVHNTLMG